MFPPTSWLEISIRVWPDDVDVVADLLREVAPDGVSIAPAIRTLDHDNFAYEYLDAPSLLQACVPAPFGARQRRALRHRIARLELARPPSRLRYAEVVTSNWSDEWKRFFHVLRVGRITVRPSWEAVIAKPGELLVELDPGEAFGTGQHETTRLCLAALDAYLSPGADILDVGTGSGILAIAAARLGAAHVRAVDIDTGAVEVARENARRNGVADVVVVAAGSLGADWPWPESSAGSADIVVVNISSAAVLALLPACVESLRTGGLCVLSGFIAAAADRVEAAASACGLRSMQATGDGDWRCLIAAKPAF